MTYFDGTFTQTEYDAAGRVVANIDERGNRTEYDYNAAGQRIVVRDALNHETVFDYDATTVYSYDNNDRLQSAGGETIRSAYDGG